MTQCARPLAVRRTGGDHPFAVAGRLRADHARALAAETSAAGFARSRWWWKIAFAPVFAGNPDVDQILAPNAASSGRFRPQLALNLARRRHQRAPDAGSARRACAPDSLIFAFSRCTTSASRARRRFWSVDRKVHTAEHLASAMFYLGVPATEIPRARLFAAPASRPRPYAVLHPFASAAAKDLAARKLPRCGETSGRRSRARTGVHRRRERRSVGLQRICLLSRRAARRSEIAARRRGALRWK